MEIFLKGTFAFKLEVVLEQFRTLVDVNLLNYLVDS